MNMISVEMEDVLAVLQLCKPYIIGNDCGRHNWDRGYDCVP